MKIVKEPVIKKFDAIGYMDGQRNLNGNMFDKIEFGFSGDGEHEVLKELNNELVGDKDGEEIGIEVHEYDFKPNMIFKGYVRGKVEKGHYFEFVGHIRLYHEDVGHMGNVQCSISAYATDSMAEMYETVFEDNETW